MRKFTFADHYHKKMDIPDDQMEYIKYINTMTQINNQTKETLPEKAIDATLGNQEDPTSLSSKDKKIDIPTDNNVTLPEHFSNLKFYLYNKIVFRLRLNHFHEERRLIHRSASDPRRLLLVDNH